MNEIIIKVADPKEAEKLVLLLFKNGYKAKSASVHYNIRTGIPGKFRRLEQYPLILKGTLDGVPTRLLVSPLAVGQGSAGSLSLLKILKAAEFYVEREDILTIRKFDPDTGTVSLSYSH